MINKSPRRLPCHSNNQQGLSLIELLIAMTLLSAVALSVLPLMMRSIADRHRGWEATEASNFAQSELEPLLAAPYQSTLLQLVPTATEKRSHQSWTEGSRDFTGDHREGWVDSAATGGRGNVLWQRETFIRWYQVNALGTPLTGNAESTDVNIKELQVHVTSERQAGGLGAGQDHWIRVLRAF